MYDVIILGAGGTGREICEMFDEVFDKKNFRLKGFLSDVLDILDGFEIETPLLGTIKDYEIQENDRFILAIGNPSGRRKVAEKILSCGGKFVNFIHPSAKVLRSAKFGQGVIIFPFAYVGANSEIGDFCFMNIFAGCGHDTKLGKFSEMAPYSVIAGGVCTGEECFLAMHSAVSPKIILGNRVVISQGSTTQKNQPDDSLIVGVPGKRLRKIGNMF